LIYCLKEHCSGFYPSTGEFRQYCLDASRTPEFIAKQEAEREQLKMLESASIESIPMPQSFRKLIGKFTKKMSIHDAVEANRKREILRRGESIKFFGYV